MKSIKKLCPICLKRTCYSEGLVTVGERTDLKVYRCDVCGYEIDKEMTDVILNAPKSEVFLLRQSLNRLIHAYEDNIDDYGRIDREVERGKKLLPNYSKKRIYTR